MGNPIFYYESIEDATLTIVSVGEDTNQPKENLQDLNNNVKWKALNANTSGRIDIDLGSARTADYLILGGHNYTSTSVGIKLSVDDGDDPGFGSEAYVIGSAGAYHDYTSNDASIWYESFSSTSKRYWRLYLEAMGSSTYQEIGTIYLGEALSHAVNREWGQAFRWLSNVTSRQTIGGQVYTNQNGSGRRTWELRFADIDSNHWNDIFTFLQTVENSQYAFYFDPGEAIAARYFVRAVGNEHGTIDKDWLVYDTDSFRLIEES